jgi:hypothetical protein
MREKRGLYMVVVRKPEGRRPLGRPSRRCEDNIKIDLKMWDRDMGGSIWLRIGTGGELL